MKVALQTRRAFTLLELLLVMALMGFMGTVAVGGYRGMQRGMEERGVMQNVNEFLKSAYSRAQIDHLPVVVYLWNETVQLETDNDNLTVVGHAVAVRPFGRITGVQGNFLYDEYGDLSSSAEVAGDERSVGTGLGSDIYIYKMDMASSQMKRSIISQMTICRPVYEPIFGGKPPTVGSSSNGGGMSNSVEIPVYCYILSSADKSGVVWQTGDAYGFEFQELVLPYNYIFGKSYSPSATMPIQNLSETPRFLPGENSGSGSAGEAKDYRIDVYTIRPNSSGEMTPYKVGSSKDPRERNGT